MQSARKKRRQIVILIICELLLILFVLETVSRLYWKVKYDIPLFSPGKIIYAFYPELKSVKETTIPEKNGPFKILLLGGSVLTKQWGNIQELLQEKLTRRSEREFIIYNLAASANTSFDSYYKYKYLYEKQFDLVLFYHGINETRANNAPPEIFEQDYSHYSWYKHILTFEQLKPVTKYIALPFTLKFLIRKLSNKLGISNIVRTSTLNPSWLHHGSSIKTAESFKKNLKGILTLSSLKSEPFLLMTFAYYVPDDYEESRFKSKSLDYAQHLTPIKIWGTPENVVAGINSHNSIIYQLSTDYKNIYFVDQVNLIPKAGEYFNDICHFTYKGSEAFVNNIADIILEMINNPDRSAGPTEKRVN